HLLLDVTPPIDTAGGAIRIGADEQRGAPVLRAAPACDGGAPPAPAAGPEDPQRTHPDPPPIKKMFGPGRPGEGPPNGDGQAWAPEYLCHCTPPVRIGTVTGSGVPHELCDRVCGVATV